MPFFLDTRETSQRFGSHVTAFRSLLDADHIHHGSPDDLFEFAKVLEDSNQFRLDLSTLVKAIVHQESDELLLTDMMSIIAASVGGPLFADTSADLIKPTNTLMEFLLGTGCWMKFGSPAPPRSQSTAQSRPVVRTEEARPIRISSPSSIPIARENPEDRTGLLDAGELRQMLTRLEINTLQVKLHLDYIEQRISRIEPQHEVPASSPQHLSQPEAVAGRVADPPSEKVPAFEAGLPTRVDPELSTRGRAIFSPQLQPNPYPSDLSETDDDFSSPTFAYASEKGRSVIPLAIFLALLAVVAVFLLFAHTDKGQTLLKAGMLRLETVRALFSNAPAATLPPAPVQTASDPVAPDTPVTSATRTPAPAPIQTPSSTTTTSPSPEPPTPPTLSRARYVQSNIMEGNLLSAPRPEYPSLARANHISGKVTLQATISTSGSVEALRAINGPRPLREAAIEAVRKWRYKPYSVDGRPVEVATTVYVDFSPGSSLAASR